MSRAEELEKIISDAKAELDGIAPMHRMSVRELAKATGVSPTTALRIKRGETPDIATAKKLMPYMIECPCCGQKLKKK